MDIGDGVLFMWMVERLSGVELADVSKTLLYRPEFFGRAMLDLAAEMMRAPRSGCGKREYCCADYHAEPSRRLRARAPASARVFCTGRLRW
jgi:hypothetical protein